VRHLLIPTAAAAVLFAVPAHADELQSRLLAGMQAARATAFAFQQTIVVETTGQARRTIVERYGARRPAAVPRPHTAGCFAPSSARSPAKPEIRNTRRVGESGLLGYVFG
ncbi:hypothetical protein ACFQZU_22305, partial [Streptomonospora algeriensis]